MKKTIMAIMLMPLMALATTWYVDGTNGSDGYSGKSQSAAKKTIQATIDVSSEGDEILVSAGTYGKIVSSNKSIVIRSINGPYRTIIDGNGVGRCAELGGYKDRRHDDGMETNTVVIGFTLKNGVFQGDGGAASGGHYINCVFKDNRVDGYDMGGAVVFALLENCLLVNNKAVNGGGASVSILKNCTLTGNTATGSGGGAYDSDLYNCIVYGNEGGEFHAGFNVCITENMYTDDPHFVDSEGGNYRLASDSPCIDAGDNSYVVGETDLNGGARVVNDIVDVGCCEYVTRTTWYVNGASGSDLYSGKSVMAAKKTIQAAIDLASEGDEILVAAGTYGKIASPNKGIVIRAMKGFSSTIIDGREEGRCAELGGYKDRRQDEGMETNTVVIGFTLQNGVFQGDGGAASGGHYINCVFKDNKVDGCDMGGAVVFALLENCLLLNNKAVNGGGASVSILKNCTLTGNTATGSGGGAYDSDLYNCIVYGNGGGEFHTGFNVCITENMYTDDPHFVDSEEGNYRLAADSPCIDAGDNSYVGGETDLDGKARIVNGTVDIGCYEYVGGDPIVYRTVTFDGNGGVVSAESRSVKNGAAVGELPTATRAGYDFVGWFTAALGGTEVTAATVVDSDVTYFAQWKAQETDVPTYGPWGEGEDVANPDKLGPTCLEDMTLTINGSAGAEGDVVAVYRTDTGAVCGLGKILDDSGMLTVMCFAPTGTKLHFKVWIAASGVVEPTVVDCDAKCDLAAPTSGSFYSGHALVVSGDKELTLTLKNADWQTVSFNVVPDDPSPAAVFADVADTIAAVTQGVNYWMPGKAGTLKAIEVGKGYWVKTTEADVSWTVSGKTNPSVEIPLVAGWNLIGYAPEDEQTVASALKTALAEKAIDYVTYGVAFYPGGTLAKMSPGKAYWVHSTRANYSLVYDQVQSLKFEVSSLKMTNVAGGGRGATALPMAATSNIKLQTSNSELSAPTYGPFGESEDVTNPDKLGPTMFTDVALTVDGEAAAVGDCVAVYRGDTGSLCGLGKVLGEPGALTIVCYAPQGVALTFKAWVAASGVVEPTIVACKVGGAADTEVGPPSGEIVTETLALAASTTTPIYTVIAGAKCSVDVGLKGQGYSTKTLPKGLSYSDKTGLVTGTCKTATDDDGVTVTFTKKGAEDVVMIFAVRAEKKPTVACECLAEGSFVVGVTGGALGDRALPSIPLLFEAESGVKSVTAKNLPTGMKLVQDKTTKAWSITGVPTKAATYETSITLTTTAGNKVTEKFTVAVAALPSGATGTFNGFVFVDATSSSRLEAESSSSERRDEDAASTGTMLNCGTLQVTVGNVGKITAKVVAAAGTYSFSASGWDRVNEGVYSVKMETKKGDVLTLACDANAAWNAKQLTGTFTAPAVGGATALPVEAQKNAFGKQWFFDATPAAREGTRSTGDGAESWVLSFAENPKAAALTVTLNADGKTTVAGTLNGTPVVSGTKTTTPSYKVSSSGYADVSGIGSGAIFADFAPVIIVNKVKKVLSLRANLWFDRSNDHAEGVGSAIFAE